MVEKIISGGQTGADMGGLLGAKDCGIRTGGWAPKGWKTETGPNLTLRKFGLVQATTDSYKYRSKLNVMDSHVTAIFGDIKSPGSQLTLNACKTDSVPFLLNPDAEELREFCRLHEAEIVNIAGNRESKCPGIEERVRGIVRDAFQM